MLIKVQIKANENSLFIGPISFPSSSELLQLVLYSIVSDFQNGLNFNK